MTPGPQPLAPSSAGLRGGPLIMLLLLVAGWGMLRAVWWEDPFAPPAAALATSPPASLAPRSLANPLLLAGVVLPEAAYDPAAVGLPVMPGATWAEAGGAGARRALRPARLRRLLAYDPAPEIILPGVPRYPSLPPGASGQNAALAAGEAVGAAPVLPGARPQEVAAAKKPKRWSLDAWAFQRQGSAVGPVSEGRVPVYGASQAGAVLQYRLAPSSRHDPRLYLRAYRAMVVGGESEFALGASVRPLAGVPLRVAAEGRYTRFAAGSAIRPAVLAISELPPMTLPFGTQLEAYAQGGWVGGPGSTAFADGQATIMRELPFVGRMSKDALRLSLGAGAWGGAQESAQRLDIGPTMRMDFKVGRMPARVSVDWRHRAAGTAAPGSGVAATITTGF